MAGWLAVASALACVGCGCGALTMDAYQEDGYLVADVWNDSGGSITRTDPIHAFRLLPDEDVVIFFRRKGVYISQCSRLDQVPVGRTQWAPGASLSIRLDVRQLSSMFCLEDGLEYEMGVAWVRFDGHGFRVVQKSNTQRVVASGGGRGDGSVVFVMSPDGSRLTPAGCLDADCGPARTDRPPSLGK